MIQSQPGPKSSSSQQEKVDGDNHTCHPNYKMGSWSRTSWRKSMAQVVEHLPSKCKALSSN
jgi:hypothetical protein